MNRGGRVGKSEIGSERIKRHHPYDRADEKGRLKVGFVSPFKGMGLRFHERGGSQQDAPRR